MERLTFYNNDNKRRKEMKTSAVIRPLPVNVMREVKDYVMIAIGMTGNWAGNSV